MHVFEIIAIRGKWGERLAKCFESHRWKGLAKSHIIHLGPDSAWLLWEVLRIWKQEGKRFSGSSLLFSFIDSTLWKEMRSHHAGFGAGTWCTWEKTPLHVPTPPFAAVTDHMGHKLSLYYHNYSSCTHLGQLLHSWDFWKPPRTEMNGGWSQSRLPGAWNWHFCLHLSEETGQTKQGFFVGSFIYCSVQSTGCNYHQSFLAIELAPDITVLLLQQNILANHEFTFSHSDCTAFLFLLSATGHETDPTVTNFSWVETCLLQTASWVWGCV